LIALEETAVQGDRLGEPRRCACTVSGRCSRATAMPWL